MKKLLVEYEDSGKKLTTFLTAKYPKLNVNSVYKALRKKDVKLNGKRINDNVELTYGDELEVYIVDSEFEGIKKDFSIQKVYEDENILVVNKPQDIEVEGENSITYYLKKEYEYIEPCHRIDRNTIGLVIFAKNEEALNQIIDMFKNQSIEKHYIACCYGIPKSNATINGYLFKDRKKSLVFISKEPKKGYTKITTSYKLIKENKEKNISLLDVTLHTGKTHQIRAHLAFAGLPLLGDGKYGSYEINKRFKIYKQALCSYSLTFNVEEGKLAYLNGTTIALKKVPFEDIID